MARVSTLHAWDRCREAFDAASRARLAGTRGVAFDMMLGWSSFRIGRVDEIDLDPESERTTQMDPSTFQSGLSRDQLLYRSDRHKTLRAISRPIVRVRRRFVVRRSSAGSWVRHGRTY